VGETLNASGIYGLSSVRQLAFELPSRSAMPAALAPSVEQTEKRINLVLPGKAYAELYQLSKLTKRSIKDLVRLALGLLKRAIEAQQRGEKLIITTPEGQPLKELIIPE
jgi:hypothetical protein